MLYNQLKEECNTMLHYLIAESKDHGKKFL